MLDPFITEDSVQFSFSPFSLTLSNLSHSVDRLIKVSDSTILLFFNCSLLFSDSAILQL